MDTFQTQVQREFDQLRAEVTTLRTALAQAQSTKTSSSPKLPDPEKFAGQTYKFDTWLPSIKAKLRIDGTAIGDATAQFYYVYLNLDSSVQAMVLPQLSHAESVQRWDYNSILDQLARVYDNPNKQQEAEDKLYTLRQGNDSLPAYIAKFERTLYEAGGQSWNDVNKISSFRNGLNASIRSRLAQQLTLPRVYADFLRTVQQLASKAAAPPYASAPKIATDPMDVSELQFDSTIGALTFDSPTDPAVSAQSTTKELRQLYRQTGRCVRCGSQEHYIKNCNLAPASTASGKRVTIAAVSDDDSGTYSDSGTESDSDDSGGGPTLDTAFNRV
jgi:Retrotransposon gag protein